MFQAGVKHKIVDINVYKFESGGYDDARAGKLSGMAVIPPPSCNTRDKP
jgi:hypothetical protein